MRRLAFVVALLLLWVGAADAQNGFVYTNNDRIFRINSVSAYAINADGSLTQIAGSPFLTNANGSGSGYAGSKRIAISPDNAFLFVANGGGKSISVFSIDAASGFLTLVTGSPFATGALGSVTGLAVSPDGKFLFAANTNSGDISAFVVNGDGSLTAAPGSPFATGQFPTDLKVVGGGKFLAAALASDSGGMVGMYAINADGSLAALPGSPFPDKNAGLTTSVESDCAGNRLWAMTGDGSTSGKINAFKVNKDGTLTAAPGSPFVDPTNSTSAVLLSPSEELLFATDKNDSITVFNVASDGSLTPAGTPVAVNTLANFLTTSATDATGQFLYGAGYPNFVVGFSVDGAGTLMPLPSMPIQTGVFGALQSLVTYPNRVCKPPVIPVTIDIKPSDSLNRVNPTSQGKLTVAILSTADFNAPARVDASTLTFGHSGTEHSLAFCETPVDVNGDGLLDLQCHFSTPLAAFQPGDTQGFLLGMTVEGVQIAGADAVSLVSSTDTAAPAKKAKVKHTKVRHTKKTHK